MKLALTGIAAALVLAAGAAPAQQAPSDQGPKADVVKTVGDWQVRCFGVQNQNPCDQFWQQVDPRTGQRMAAVSIAYAPNLDRHLVVIIVPLGVSIPKGLTVQTDSYTSPLMHYRMCSREGCFVQMADNSLVEALAKSGPDAKLNVAGDDGKVVSLPLSLKGFSGAHDEMVSDAKARAKPAPAPAKP
ncbi:MAG TPA: invasion associated locus B family protein [Rhizomicrobium sp.]|jgi:invasion protein IalB|nr:invasion associated locus B family protein [Rhizomicrobium sp.]